MRTLRAYRFALDPNDSQLAGLRRHAGAARFVYNWGLAFVKAALAQRDAEKSYGLDGDALTPVPWTLPALRLRWNQVKNDATPWWAECSKEAFSAGLDQLARALKNFSASRKGTRKGRRVGFPRFKKRGKARDSSRYTTGTYGPAGALAVKLPRIGRVKAHEPMRALTSCLTDGSARLLGATVSRTAGRWFVAFTVEVDREVPQAPSRRQRAGGPVGVDLGVKHLAVLSTGETVPNPKHYQRAERKLRTASRAYARSRPGSAGRVRRAAALATIQARIANRRRDGLHKFTTRLALDHDVIVVEDLHVAGMVRGRRLAKAVAAAGFGEIRRQLDYKTVWYGSRLRVADRWYPSSKTCSGCGWRNPSLTLSDRVFHCQSCGLVADRDHNAAINLANLVAASTSETRNARGADRKTVLARQVAGKREPGTEQAGQARGAPPKGEAA
ncbi:IS607 family element RNA-guided endonuclease TnpB [Parafrankia sp. EUN1f]|uniref:IS607 family element RNA-guided endonuclease TnpB n=1 Tax=Parafrankia sp. EUN1f TaxID=102897 RepID=UPI0001C46B87|nr:IS607 family element RNA-guided endonuclease TnpB [Parafrankia sp. EUN1f]EFC83113.1 transposase, IS605 OrfB family [Parafrankia sp. EUN1f]